MDVRESAGTAERGHHVLCADEPCHRVEGVVASLIVRCRGARAICFWRRLARHRFLGERVTNRGDEERYKRGRERGERNRIGGVADLV